MVALTAVSYETPSPEVSLGRARLEQARREADQAEAYARQMRATADRAEVDASKGQDKVSALRTQVTQVQSQSQARTQEDATYSSQLKKKMETPISPAKQEALASLSTVARNGFSFPSNPLTAYSKASSLVGMTGAKTSGLIVSQKA